MNPNQREILPEYLKISHDDFKWLFIADYYDGPISGLAIFEGRVVRFCCFPEDVASQSIYVFHELTQKELADELRQKTRFEEMVHTHWSYDGEGNALPSKTGSKEDTERYFQENPPTHKHDPRDKPILAWVDLAKITPSRSSTA